MEKHGRPQNTTGPAWKNWNTNEPAQNTMESHSACTENHGNNSWGKLHLRNASCGVCCVVDIGIAEESTAESNPTNIDPEARHSLKAHWTEPGRMLHSASSSWSPSLITTGFPEFLFMKDIWSSAIIHWLKQLFMHYGCSEEIVMDNNPQFASAEFNLFLEESGIMPLMEDGKWHHGAPLKASPHALHQRGPPQLHYSSSIP